MKRELSTCLILSIGALTMGCESKAGTGALAGGGTGAVVGGVAAGGTGALAGAAIGTVGGAMIGSAMDKSDKKKLDAETRYEVDHTKRMTPKLLVKLNNQGISKREQRRLIYQSKPMKPTKRNMEYLERNGIAPSVRHAVVDHYEKYYQTRS